MYKVLGCLILCMQLHRAPEQTDDEFGARGPHTDVWGFATTILQLATGQQPYKDLTLLPMVTAMSKDRAPAVPDTLPVWLQHILKSCFSGEVVKRPTVLQLLQVKPLSVWLIASCAACCCGDFIHATFTRCDCLKCSLHAVCAL